MKGETGKIRGWEQDDEGRGRREGIGGTKEKKSAEKTRKYKNENTDNKETMKKIG